MVLSNTDLYFRIYVYFIAFILGTVMGSFLNCYAYRICHNQSIIKGRSKCGACNHTLGPKDLVPIFSYILSKGKCRYCGTKLSPRYLISEIVSGIIFVLVVMKFGLSLQTIEYLILCSLMLCMSFADLEDSIIPDRLVIFGILNRIIFILIRGNTKELLTALINGLIIAVPILLLSIIMSKVLKKEAMGGGDIKLFFLLASYFSLGENLLSVLLSCFIGLLFSVLTKKTKEEFPFGPSICLAYFITLLVGSYIVSWYMGLYI